MTKGLTKKILIAAVLVAALSVVFFISFQYAFLVDFPIGHDAGHHVATALKIEQRGFFNLKILKSSIYPIPLLIFSLFHKISGMAWPKLFINTICLFLFLTAAAWAYFTTRITNNWQIGIISGVFLASSRWLADALRIGFITEAWAWLVFVLAAFCLVKQKFWPLIIVLILLFFSHPLVFSVFILTLIIYSMVIFITKSASPEKLFLAKVFSVLIMVGLGIIIFFPQWLNHLLSLAQAGRLEGARSLLQIALDSDKYRIFLYLVSIFGVFKAASWWPKREIKYLYSLLLVSLGLVQLHLLGINFWEFRFYPYLEMSMAFFAAIGLFNLIKTLVDLVKWKYNYLVSATLLILLTIILILPNLKVNRAIALWQSENYQLLAVCPPQDRQAFDWVKNNTPAKSRFLSPTKWGAWLEPLAERRVYQWDGFFNPAVSEEKVFKVIKKYRTHYLYFSSVQPPNPVIEKDQKNFGKIYQKDGVRIYRVMIYYQKSK